MEKGGARGRSRGGKNAGSTREQELRFMAWAVVALKVWRIFSLQEWGEKGEKENGARKNVDWGIRLRSITFGT